MKNLEEDALEHRRIARAAQLFVEARNGASRLTELPSDCRPANAEEVNEIIREVTRLLDKEIGGWKINFLYKPRQVPLICPLFAANIFESPAKISPRITRSLLAEPEIAFRLITDLPPRAERYQPAEIARAVVACPALELNDTRFDTCNRTMRQMLDDPQSVLSAHADHQTSGAFVIGEPQPAWEDVDFARQAVSMSCGDRLLVEREGGHAFTDPFLPVVVLANELRRDQGMKAGQIVATGSFSGFFAVEANRPVVAEFVGFGRAEAMFLSE